ncbi:hypothetical protein K491DRAFT_758996 [Lophiostoma macrostomum CBS 122681]|uniref:Uncharacterized protein n=1 Tax=Lophiostoma macrostomum CBS 122681 TaxID=1314788 RepID=A0A6A6T622_9PLEO|nr:hypothetical protein K491DRAFT_758996 [Lophiostoma macrostomum CBS 122681]
MTETLTLANAQLIKELKELILTDIRALYAPQNPPLTNFDIIASGRVGYLQGKRYNYICAQAIVYTKPNSLASWKLLATGSERETVDAAFGALWTEVQSKMLVVTGKYCVIGDVLSGWDEDVRGGGECEERG